MTKNKAQKFYTVWAGKVPGVYDRWDECRRQINGFPEAKYMAFTHRTVAESALAEGWEMYYGRKDAPPEHSPSHSKFPFELKNAYACDASCPNNPGRVEYRTVSLETGEIILHRHIAYGTNNLGEFLGIVHTLAHFRQKGIRAALYSDSATALSWVRKKKVISKLPRNEKSKEIFDLTDRALNWLKQNAWNSVLKKWETEKWGEIPADFGRK